MLFWFSYLLCDCCLVFHPKRILYVGVRSTSCTIPSEIINPTTQIPPPPYFCTSHDPLPTPTVKLENLFGAIQTQMFYQYVIIILLLTDRMDVHKYQWLGMSLQSFPSPFNVISKDIAIQTAPPPPALSPSVKQNINRFLIIIAENCFYHKCTSIIYCLYAGGRCVAV